jgi:hypothetical protein
MSIRSRVSLTRTGESWAEGLPGNLSVIEASDPFIWSEFRIVPSLCKAKTPLKLAHESSDLICSNKSA